MLACRYKKTDMKYYFNSQYLLTEILDDKNYFKMRFESK